MSKKICPCTKSIIYEEDAEMSRNLYCKHAHPMYISWRCKYQSILPLIQFDGTHRIIISFASDMLKVSSDQIFSCLGLCFVLVRLTIAMPSIDTGVGPFTAGPEETIQDFAILTNDDLGNLPGNFTICTSVSTDALLGRLHPFQLLHDNGKPWVTFAILPALKHSTQHRLSIKVREEKV